MKATALSPLSQRERRDLESCEAVLRQNLSAFVDAGLALAKIRDARLYREQFSTFEDYCQQRWGFGRAHAYRLIGAATVGEGLSPIGDTPDNEAQARELLKVPPKNRPAVLDRAGANGKPTAAKIRQARTDFERLSAKQQMETVRKDEAAVHRAGERARRKEALAKMQVYLSKALAQARLAGPAGKPFLRPLMRLASKAEGAR